MPKGKQWKLTESERQKLSAAQREIIAALRERDARLAIAWDVDLRQVIGEDGSIALNVEDRGYAKAIERAEEGDPTQLIARLRAHIPLTADADLNALARYLERLPKRLKRGRVSKSERQKVITALRERVARLTDPADYDALALDIERAKSNLGAARLATR